MLLVWLAQRALRAYQRRVLQKRPPAVGSGHVRLVGVVSTRCVACTAQKNVLAQLRERYPPSVLAMTVIDAELDPDAARAWAIVTVPSTLVLSAEGIPVHANNRFAPLGELVRQIESQLSLAPPTRLQ